ncbi:hypothetical protein [Kribbella sp. NPDC051770]|uniref:hypothetical protein n=1 Tax=Kribbella sp. NPDC051770 TaxID=3155413 RepID=UPI00341F1F8D
MNRGLLNSLSGVERQLMDETESEALQKLDEDELLELHQRVRRARTKHVKNYRRAAGAAVVPAGGRGMAYPANQRDRDKAELFEGALARVSREVAAAASRASMELRSERLAAARAGKATGATANANAKLESMPPKTAPRKPVKTTGGLKKDASSRAAGARRQARKDAR